MGSRASVITLGVSRLVGSKTLRPLCKDHNAPTDADYIYVRQDGYNVKWILDTNTYDHTMIGRYINETHISGLLTRVTLADYCVIVSNVMMIARDNKSYCFKSDHHQYTSTCGSAAPLWEYCAAY
ncbi:unnamed protein product [Didymodactylos carnosus]|uniref:Uncharacterized protein n=1 Tax=Didymodactylos carnosus TaxID=1234261 RepID=A0A815NSE3_9BILA|nr:unnamed protein product [Didymodactylos carnosus]CAF4314922.1 unnamed protein product [Didymodactylos carnosus]